MLEINVNVSSPDIVQALRMLAEAIQTKAAPTAAAPVTEWVREAPAPVAAAPVTSAVPAPEPVVPVTPAPVAAPGYTIMQVAKAGADLLQSHRELQPALEELIHRYGVQTVAELPQDKLGAFATELRQMGAQI